MMPHDVLHVAIVAAIFHIDDGGVLSKLLKHGYPNFVVSIQIIDTLGQPFVIIGLGHVHTLD